MYQTSLGDPERRSLDDQLRDYVELFGLRSSPKDFGDSVVFSERVFELEVFKASDSIWWEHNELAYREEPATRSRLPSEETAIELADELCNKLGMDMTYAEYSHVSYSKLIAMDVRKNKETEYKTEINVNYSFKLNGSPVEGPGAKIQVSFVERNTMCEFYYFWRDPRKDVERPILSPDDALDVFCKDAAFSKLSPGSAAVKIDSIDFVYYALPPLEVQKYYLPTYRIEGTVATKHHVHEFTNYLLALDLTEREMKENGFVTEVSPHRIL